VTSRTRMLTALALVLVILVGTGLAAGRRDGGAGVATAAGTSLTTAAPESSTTSTVAPSTTAATEPVTTEPPATEAPTTAAPEPVTVAPTTAAPVRKVPPTTVPAPTTSTTFPAPPPTRPPVVPLDPAEAFARAKALEAASAAPPPTAPGPAAAPAPGADDDPLASLNASDQAFLACVRWRESRGDYTVVNRSSGAGGAYQFLQSTWNNTVSHLGRDDLRGMRPNEAAPHDQDMVAVHLLQWYGRSPWGGAC
jgi:hypothetical protein